MMNTNDFTPATTAVGSVIWPGSRVRVFDYHPCVHGTKTPCSLIMQPATVLRRYGRLPEATFTGYAYPDLVDVIFDHNGKESRGHFTDGVTLLPNSYEGT